MFIFQNSEQIHDLDCCFQSVFSHECARVLVLYFDSKKWGNFMRKYLLYLWRMFFISR